MMIFAAVGRRRSLAGAGPDEHLPIGGPDVAKSIPNNQNLRKFQCLKNNLEKTSFYFCMSRINCVSPL